MARIGDLGRFARKHDLTIISIADLIRYRREHEKLIERLLEVALPTRSGDWKVAVYRSQVDDTENLAFIKGKVGVEPTLVRVHSECLTGDVFGSLRCDCGEQLQTAMDQIDAEGKGVLLYMRQEGRGIGLVNKLRAYQLQDQGLDTVEANEKLGFPADLRDYGIGAQILADLGLQQIRLLTNNPKKIVGLEGYGLQVVDRVAIEIPANQSNVSYLKTKQSKLGHLLTLVTSHTEPKEAYL
jgi:3,4-dihydroxy 2-butanone 4-phosphate synthase/GTP cyclohydrolase II